MSVEAGWCYRPAGRFALHLKMVADDGAEDEEFLFLQQSASGGLELRDHGAYRSMQALLAGIPLVQAE